MTDAVVCEVRIASFHGKGLRGGAFFFEALNPYLKFVLGDSSAETSAIDGGGVKPFWQGEERRVNSDIGETPTMLRVECWHKSRKEGKGHRFLGKTTVPIPVPTDNEEQVKMTKAWYNLVGENDARSKSHGSVLLGIAAVSVRAAEVLARHNGQKNKIEGTAKAYIASKRGAVTLTPPGKAPRMTSSNQKSVRFSDDSIPNQSSGKMVVVKAEETAHPSVQQSMPTAAAPSLCKDLSRCCGESAPPELKETLPTQNNRARGHSYDCGQCGIQRAEARWLTQIFKKYDPPRLGNISKADLTTLLNKELCGEYTAKELKLLAARLEDDSGQISFKAFLFWWTGNLHVAF